MPQIEQIIQRTIASWTSAFPGRISSWYLLGSHANGTAVALSDIDLFFVLNQKADSPEDEARAVVVIQDLKDRFTTPIEAWGETLEFLQRLPQLAPVPRALIHLVSIKSGSRLLQGTDIRDQIPLPPLDKYSACLADIAAGWRERRRSQPESKEDTKLLVQSVLSCAAAIAVRNGATYIPSKAGILGAYEKHVGGEWLPLVRKVHEQVWQRWQYRIPSDEASRRELKELHAIAANFERYCESVRF